MLNSSKINEYYGTIIKLMIDEIKRFVLVAKEKQITKVAAELFITQSALSQSIQRLEKELDVQLLENKGKNIEITPEGEVVALIGMKILDLWKKLHDKEALDVPQQTHVVGMFDQAALVMGDFFRNHPAVQNTHIELVIEASSQLLSKLQIGLVDIAICVTDPQKELSGYKNLTCIAEFTEELIPVSAEKLYTPLAKTPFILYNKESNTRKQIDTVFAKAGIAPIIFAESTSTTYTIELARLGCGVAILPKNIISAEILQKQLFIYKTGIRWYRKFGIFIHERAAERHAIFANNIAHHLKQKTNT